MREKNKFQYSFGVLKPDCIRRNLVSKAFELVESNKLEIIFKKEYLFSREDVEHLYERCLDAPWFNELVEYMTSGVSILYITKTKLENVCAIETLNNVTGFRIPEKAKEKTLRKLGTSVKENIAHSTSDIDKFWYEVRYFLKKEEIDKLM